MSEKFDVTVIGGGPGGYVCAIRLSQLGFKTACVEFRGSLGGTCLNVGCIPSKSLLNLSENFIKAKNFQKLGIEISDLKLNLDKMMQNKEKAVTILTKGVEFLFKKNKVSYFKGIGKFKSKNKILIVDKNNQENLIETANTVIATGSEATSIPGINFDENRILSSTGALSLKEVPKKMLVVGGGYIGSKLVNKLIELNYKVTVIDTLKFSSNSLNHLFGNDNFKFIKGDVRNYKLIKNLINKNEYIIPLAALVGAPICEKNKKEAISTNLESIKMMMKFISKTYLQT